MEIELDDSNDAVLRHQILISKLLDADCMANAKSVRCSSFRNTDLILKKKQLSGGEVRRCKNIVGGLLYLATETKQDPFVLTNILNAQVASPTKQQISGANLVACSSRGISD